MWAHEKKLGKYTLKGYSRGDDRTGFYIPELELHFDAGIPTKNELFYPKYIFMSNGSLEKVCSLATLIPPNSKTFNSIIVPEESIELFKNLIRDQLRLNEFAGKIEFLFPVVKSNMKTEMKIDETVFISSYKLSHYSPTCAYGIHKEIRKLLDAYKDVNKAGLIALKNNGIEITRMAKDCIIAYVNGTGIKGIENNLELLQYKYLIVECTYFKNEKTSNNCIHWRDLKQYPLGYKDTTFILTNLHIKYTDEDIKEFNKTLPDNVVIWGL